MKNKIALLIAILLFVSLMPFTAFAASGTISADGTYDIGAYGNDSIITINGGLDVVLTNTGGSTYTNLQIDCIGANTTLTIDGIKINNSANDNACALAFIGTGNNLVLNGQSELTSGLNQSGIRVIEGTALSISGSGEVVAQGSRGGAGIGGSDHQNGGTINILSGKVTAIGGTYAAGIGGGEDGHGTGASDKITISGGEVHASGDDESAAIGSGYDADGGNIEITGGTVVAIGAPYGAGIGSGTYGECGNIVISGGNITASSLEFGAGIGTGDEGQGGTITITGGTIRATGGREGAGIGGGEGGYCDTTITGGTIYAQRGAGAGEDIGVGEAGTGGSVEISGTGAVFLRNDIMTAPSLPDGHQHKTPSDAENPLIFQDNSVYGIHVDPSWTDAIGGYFLLCTLAYDANGGTGSASGGVYQAGVDILLDDGSSFAKNGYHYSGWNTAANGSGTNYVPNTTVAMPSIDTTLYVKWTSARIPNPETGYPYVVANLLWLSVIALLFGAGGLIFKKYSRT